MFLNFSFLKSDPLLIWNNYKIPLIEKNETIDWDGTKRTFYYGYIIKDEKEYEFKIDPIDIEYYVLNPSTDSIELLKTIKYTHKVIGKVMDTLTQEKLIRKLESMPKIKNLKENPTISLSGIEIISNSVKEMKIEKCELSTIKSIIINSKVGDKINVKFQVQDDASFDYFFNLIFFIK